MSRPSSQELVRPAARLPWLALGEPFPPTSEAWDADSPAPGLLAGGGGLDVPTLLTAYRHGIFPWFSDGQPILWWSPDPRMVLNVRNFRLHRSLRKTLERFRATPGCEIRVDTAFGDVIRACAQSTRTGQSGTWIQPAMIEAYEQLHAAGWAHSVETWIDGRLVGGLYGVAIGKAVFGESMFTHVTDGSKIALAALVCFCRQHDIEIIDCQQNTRHLASLGASEIPRKTFVSHVARQVSEAGPRWQFKPLYWAQLLRLQPTAT